MAMTIPVLTPVPAGYVVQLSDLQAMTSACTFLMTKPLARIHMASSGQSLPTGSGTAITFNTVDFDTDGTWNSGSPTRLTIQTPGFYKVRYTVGLGTSTSGNSWVQVTTGTNNPAGSGVLSQCYGAYATVTASQLGSAGIIPQYLYALDYIQVYYAGTAATTVGVGQGAPSLAIEYVST